jgi:hypothetical protein
MRLFCVCAVLRVGSGIATGWSLVQGVLPSVKNDYGTEYEARVLNGLEEPLKKKMLVLFITCSYPTKRDITYVFPYILNICRRMFHIAKSIGFPEIFGISHVYPWRYRLACEHKCLPTCHNPFRTRPYLLIIVRVWSIALQLPVYLFSDLSKSSSWLMGSSLLEIKHRRYCRYGCNSLQMACYHMQ